MKTHPGELAVSHLISESAVVLWAFLPQEERRSETFFFDNMSVSCYSHARREGPSDVAFLFCFCFPRYIIVWVFVCVLFMTFVLMYKFLFDS